jgi:hypothetical protein
MSDPKNENPEKGSNSLSLSEALLAPLSSIFEAQIHASRGFLNFLLQMGFRHKYTKADEDKLKQEPEKNKEILEKIAEEKADKEKLDQLTARINELKQIPDLDSGTKRELNDKISEATQLKKKWGDLYQQFIPYFDQNGVERILSVPNLSLLPIKPLAIQSANFKFELRVKDEIKSIESSIRSGAKATVKRPWFLIDDPKMIEGEFVPQQKENSTDKTIKIDVTIGSVDMPYGLHKLISSLTHTAEDNEKTKTN